MDPKALDKLRVLNDFVNGGVASQIQFDEYDCLLEYRRYEMQQAENKEDKVEETAHHKD